MSFVFRTPKRCHELRLVGLIAGVVCGFAAPSAGVAAEDRPAIVSGEISRLIDEAGDVEDEAQRYRALKQLDARSDLDARLRSDLATLLPVVNDWANGREKNDPPDHSRAAENGFLCRFISSHSVQPAGRGPVYPAELSAGSPLRPIWNFYRARILIQRVIQSRPLRTVDAEREAYYGEARRLLEETRQAYPKNRVVGMYLGEPLPWPKRYASDPRAPEWANLQREGIEKLTDVIHWWIDQRQLPDGQFGGGWGDDVEMWRWWTPVMVAFDDSKMSASQERTSNGMFHLPHMQGGYTTRMTDVEHTAEDSTDAILPLLHLRPDDPVWKQRALKLADLMRERWSGRNQRGLLQFRSIYFNLDAIDSSPERAFDTVFHPRVTQPALLLWQRTGDATLGALFGDWLKTWVDATARADNGKPAGVLPSAIHWPDGGVGIAGKPWWAPFPEGHNDALYNWPSSASLMTSALLLAGHMSRDSSYYEPILSMAAIRARHLGTAKRDAPPGSEAWCARGMDDFLPDAIARYQTLTGDTRFKDQLAKENSGYAVYLLSGDERSLIDSLTRNAEAFRSNWEAYTSEVRWTDRVLAFSSHYLSYLPRPAPPTPALQALYSTVTGDTGNPLLFPLNRVRWLTPPRDIAALVGKSGSDRFEAQLFHFGSQPRPMSAEVYLLDPGSYDVSLVAKATGKSLHRQRVLRDSPRTRVNFELPPRELCEIRVQKTTD